MGKRGEPGDNAGLVPFEFNCSGQWPGPRAGQTSSIRAIWALSPSRGPSLRMRV